MATMIYNITSITTIKSFTSLEQSKRLAEFLPRGSADMYYPWDIDSESFLNIPIVIDDSYYVQGSIDCWSLAALLNILHNKTKNIPSLSGGGYKDGKYISDWCLDYEFDDGDYQKTFADNPVDACYKMIIKLHELNLL